jgi:hypothetical protein
MNPMVPLESALQELSNEWLQHLVFDIFPNFCVISVTLTSD